MLIDVSYAMMCPDIETIEVSKGYGNSFVMSIYSKLEDGKEFP